MMRRKNSQKPLILQPPAGFRTANAEGVLTLSDGLLLKPDSRGLYHLDSAHLCLLPSFIAQGWHAPRPALRAPASEHTGGAQPLTTREILNLTGAERIALKVEDGRLLMRGKPSMRLLANLRRAQAALCEELLVEHGTWIKV